MILENWKRNDRNASFFGVLGVSGVLTHEIWKFIKKRDFVCDHTKPIPFFQEVNVKNVYFRKETLTEMSFYEVWLDLFGQLNWLIEQHNLDISCFPSQSKD